MSSNVNVRRWRVGEQPREENGPPQVHPFGEYLHALNTYSVELRVSSDQDEYNSATRGGRPFDWRHMDEKQKLLALALVPATMALSAGLARGRVADGMPTLSQHDGATLQRVTAEALGELDPEHFELPPLPKSLMQLSGGAFGKSSVTAQLTVSTSTVAPAE